MPTSKHVLPENKLLMAVLPYKIQDFGLNGCNSIFPFPKKLLKEAGENYSNVNKMEGLPTFQSVKKNLNKT